MRGPRIGFDLKAIGMVALSQTFPEVECRKAGDTLKLMNVSDLVQEQRRIELCDRSRKADALYQMGSHSRQQQADGTYMGVGCCRVQVSCLLVTVIVRPSVRISITPSRSVRSTGTRRCAKAPSVSGDGCP